MTTQLSPKTPTQFGAQFGATSTTDEVLAGVDLSGKRVLVTGVSAGLGVETARTLAAHGAYVVGAARDLVKAEQATAQVRADAKRAGGLELVELDLSSLASVRACADGLMAKAQPFDLIIANAGVMACPFGLTVDGFETQFGANHLGHFVLINRIASLLRPGGRLVNLSSSGHRRANVDLEDPNFAHRDYDPFLAYGHSKTANVQFAVEFDRRHKAAGVRATAVHPGGIATELGRHAYAAPGALEQLVAQMNVAFRAAEQPEYQMKTIPQGAATSVWAAVVAPAETVGGLYCENCHVAEVLAGEPLSVVSEGVRAYALDAENAKALWAKSEEMVGEQF